jgi:hypothetical protein
MEESPRLELIALVFVAIVISPDLDRVKQRGIDVSGANLLQLSVLLAIAI